MRTQNQKRNGFTLIELLVVVGIISLMMTLLLPVMGKARAAAATAACLSNVRQMTVGLTMYISEHRGRLPDYMWVTPASPDIAWNGYWLGILDKNKCNPNTLLCPAASEVVPFNQNRGRGTARYAWTGKYQPDATPVRFNAANVRNSSYGFNRNLSAGNGYGKDGKATKLTAIGALSDKPAFFDSAWVDASPPNGTATEPAEAPPNFHGGSLVAGSPEHWNFLLSRHGRAINVGMIDGSARTVRLEDTYTLMWNGTWAKYRLPLPVF